MKTIYKDLEHYSEIGIIDEYGDFVTGLTVTYGVRKSSDNSYIISGTTSETNSVYYFNYTFTESTEYRLKWITPNTYDDGFETILVIDQPATNSGITSIEAKLDAHRSETEDRIKYILGLEQQNFRISDQIYNDDRLLTSSTIKIYNNATDCNDDVNVLKQYSMSATYDSDGKITDYRVIET